MAKYNEAVEEIENQVKNAQEMVSEKLGKIASVSSEMEEFEQRIVDLKLELTSLTVKLENSNNTLRRLKELLIKGKEVLFTDSRGKLDYYVKAVKHQNEWILIDTALHSKIALKVFPHLPEISKVKIEGVFEWQLLAALNIPGIGRSLSKDLLADRNLLQLSGMNITELIALPNIAEERGLAIINGIFSNYQYLSDLGNMLPTKKPEIKVEGLTKVCFTGKFPKNKKVYYELLERIGGYEIMNKVNKETQILVVADPTKESNKTKSAKKKGIKIMGLDELLPGDI